MAENGLTEKLQEHGWTEQDVLKWAKEQYPGLVENKALITKLFLILHGVAIQAPVRQGSSPQRKISELKDGEYATVSAIIVQEIEQRTYLGCNKCLGKVCKCDEKGQQPGEMVQLTWRSYLIGDSSGEVICNMSPLITDPMYTGTQIQGVGSYKDKDHSFTIFRLTKIEQPAVVGQGTNASPVVTSGQPVVTPAQAGQNYQAPPTHVTQSQGSGLGPATTSQTTEWKCPQCASIFNEERKLKIHLKLKHKMESGAQTDQTESAPQTQTSNTPQTGSISQPSTQQPQTSKTSEVTIETTPKAGTTRSELIRLAKVYAMLGKPYSEFEHVIVKHDDQINILKLLEEAKVKVNNEGKMTIIQATTSS